MEAPIRQANLLDNEILKNHLFPRLDMPALLSLGRCDRALHARVASYVLSHCAQTPAALPASQIRPLTKEEIREADKMRRIVAATATLLPQDQIREVTRQDIVQQRVDPLKVAIDNHGLDPQVVETLLACGIKVNVTHMTAAIKQGLDLSAKLLKEKAPTIVIIEAISELAMHCDDVKEIKFFTELLGHLQRQG
ncbi:MAG: hypothetical protein LLG04_10190 [Parachlamydia sp.]|nr:hypothetical protein [Parachlamydia sp.]